jgi:hypothetical protein
MFNSPNSIPRPKANFVTINGENMFERLQEKWGVGPVRIILILVTFALGGSLTGYLAKKLIAAFDIDSIYLYIPVYILLVTVLWPLMVILVSLPLGQFFFFRSYIRRIANKIARK